MSHKNVSDVDDSEIRRLVKDVPNFPKQGVLYKDITPVLRTPSAYRRILDYFHQRYAALRLTHIIGIESRGFFFASPLSDRLQIGLVPIRKPHKLPGALYRVSYSLEYGDGVLELQCDALSAESRVAIIDDIVATGGSLEAAIDLVKKTDATLVEVSSVFNLEQFGGVKNIKENYGFSVHTYMTL